MIRVDDRIFFSLSLFSLLFLFFFLLCVCHPERSEGSETYYCEIIVIRFGVASFVSFFSLSFSLFLILFCVCHPMKEGSETLIFRRKIGEKHKVGSSRQNIFRPCFQKVISYIYLPIREKQFYIRALPMTSNKELLNIGLLVTRRILSPQNTAHFIYSIMSAFNTSLKQ
jgi:hypothetical protein